MNILILATKYPFFEESKWLTSELVDEFLSRGISIKVLDVEWSGLGQMGRYEDEKLCVLRVAPVQFGGSNGFGLFLKWAFSSFKLYPELLRDFFTGKRYDLLICYSPCVSLASAIPLADILSRKSNLIYWDFFPIHNQQISQKIPRFLLRILKLVEGYLVRRFSRVSCMSPANLIYFNRYFGCSKQVRDVVPIWSSFLGSDTLDKSSAKLESGYVDEVLVVFGGQLVAGRGVEVILQAISLARNLNAKIKLLVCGDGPLSVLVKEFFVENPEAGSYLGSLPRDKYLEVLAYSDIGLVVTVEGVDSPTYPSKSLDYMASCMPIAACIETRSDFGKIIEAHGIGRSCDAGDSVALSGILVDLSSSAALRAELGVAGRKFLREQHAVARVADKILEVSNV